MRECVLAYMYPVVPFLLPPLAPSPFLGTAASTAAASAAAPRPQHASTRTHEEVVGLDVAVDEAARVYELHARQLRGGGGDVVMWCGVVGVQGRESGATTAGTRSSMLPSPPRHPPAGPPA